MKDNVTGGGLETEAQCALIGGGTSAQTGKWVLSLALGGRPGPGGRVGAYRGQQLSGLYASTIVQGCSLWVKLKEKRLR